jgi:hypothetical protein
MFFTYFNFSCFVFRKLLLLLSKLGPLPIAWNRRRKQFPPLRLHHNKMANELRTNAPSSCFLVTWVRKVCFIVLLVLLILFNVGLFLRARVCLPLFCNVAHIY